MVNCENCGKELDTSSVFDGEWKEYDMVICEECDDEFNFVGSKCILTRKEVA